jgi:heat shock protein HslJ
MIGRGTGLPLLAAALLGGCMVAPAPVPPIDGAPFAQAFGFAGTQWRVAAINDRAAPANDAYSISFERDRLSARFGCNHFSGDYRVHAGQLIVPILAGTRMACTGPVAAMEGMAAAVMREPMQMRWSGADALILANSGGTITLVRND